MKAYWKRFLHWSGWKKIFPFPAWADVLMFAVLGTGLSWVFAKGLEMWWPSYVLYGLSAYSLTALCIKLPGALRMEKDWLKKHPGVEGLLKNEELHFKLELYFEQFINFAYGIFKIVTGVLAGTDPAVPDPAAEKSGDDRKAVEVLPPLRCVDPIAASDADRHRISNGQLEPGGGIR